MRFMVIVKATKSSEAGAEREAPHQGGTTKN
jgi:hypothetical protein